jgi:hypothetical protein
MIEGFMPKKPNIPERSVRNQAPLDIPADASTSYRITLKVNQGEFVKFIWAKLILLKRNNVEFTVL